jgi:small subunit ribosomal protein S17
MKVFTGKVISKKMEKTATVVVSSVVVHPIYKKRFKKTKKYHVHDELGAKVGDTVFFVPCKPVSKLKRWKITEIAKDKKKKTAKKKTSKKGKK